MNHRSREEIEGAYEGGFFGENLKLILEVLLDIRELLQNQRDRALKDKWDTEVEEALEQPQRDELFDMVASSIKNAHELGEIITPKALMQGFSISYARASALIDQLEEEGIISKAERGKPRRVL